MPQQQTPFHSPILSSPINGDNIFKLSPSSPTSKITSPSFWKLHFSSFKSTNIKSFMTTKPTPEKPEEIVDRTISIGSENELEYDEKEKSYQFPAPPVSNTAKREKKKNTTRIDTYLSKRCNKPNRKPSLARIDTSDTDTIKRDNGIIYMIDNAIKDINFPWNFPAKKSSTLANQQKLEASALPNHDDSEKETVTCTAGNPQKSNALSIKVIKSTAKTIPITPPARKSSFSSDALCQHLEQHIQGLKEVKENAEHKSLPPPHSPSSPSVEEYNAILDSYRFPPVSIPERSDHVYILGAGDKVVPVRKSSLHNIVY